MSTEWLAVLNPAAGALRGSGSVSLLVRRLEQLGCQVAVANGPGDIGRLVRQAREVPGLVSVGGDGTLFELLQAMDRERQRVALVPAGRGNSLARDLGLMGCQVQQILQAAPEPATDLMAVNVTFASGEKRLFLSASTVALGYPATVAHRARPLRALRAMSYAAAALATLPHRWKARLWINEISQPPSNLQLTGIIVNNTHHIANFHGYVDSVTSDGQFEVMRMNRLLPLQLLHNLSAISGKDFYQPFPHLQTRWTRLELERPSELLLDGELFTDVSGIEVRIMPAALKVNRMRPTA